MARGTVKWFSPEKGFGFITDPAVPRDVFVHYSVIQCDGFRTLEKGDEVEYELEESERGVKALSVVKV